MTLKVDNAIAKATDWDALSRIVDQADAYYAQNKMSGDEVIRIGEACKEKANELVAEGETARQAEHDSYSKENGIELYWLADITRKQREE